MKHSLSIDSENWENLPESEARINPGDEGKNVMKPCLRGCFYEIYLNQLQKLEDIKNVYFPVFYSRIYCADGSFLVLTALSGAAAVVDWELSPENPVVGDTVDIKGTASPEEEIDVLVSFEKEVKVSDGRYEYLLEDVKIPDGFNNQFTVQAKGADDLNVRVKMILWVTKRSAQASGETATVSQSGVPPGTYMIKIDGKARPQC